MKRPTCRLARFIVEVIDQLDPRRLTLGYARRRSAMHHPAVLLALPVYGTGRSAHLLGSRPTGS